MIKKKYTEEQEKLARFAKAMGHPARIAILQFLASQECCFCLLYTSPSPRDAHESRMPSSA